MASSSNDFAEIDSKTQAVFTKKGYQLQAKLGQGAFGQVYKAINVKRDNQVCAVKVMDTTKMSSKLVEKFLPRELAALMEVNHPYAVRVYDIFKMSKKVFIFMEFAGGGDLAGYVKKNKAIKEDLACYWFNQTSQAVDYLHTTHRMAHRDIKLDNILLNEVRQVKLSDFGFANFVLDESQDIYESVSTTFCGTLPYYSPNLVAKKPYNPFKADVWSMGVVLFAMLSNRFMFHFADVKKMYQEQTDYPNYIRSRFTDTMSEKVCDLMQRIFHPDDKHRPTMAEILKHSWILSKGKTQ